jgi:hypothetical protein
MVWDYITSVTSNEPIMPMTLGNMRQNGVKGPAPPVAADEPQFPRRSEPGTMLKNM